MQYAVSVGTYSLPDLPRLAELSTPGRAVLRGMPEATSVLRSHKAELRLRAAPGDSAFVAVKVCACDGVRPSLPISPPAVQPPAMSRSP